MENTVITTFSVELTSIKRNSLELVDETEAIKEAIKKTFKDCDDIHVTKIATRNFLAR